MRINHNIAALNTLRQLSMNTRNTNDALAKLSSGKRINSAADDAAGLSISEKMKSQINGLNEAQRNAQDGISLIQTAEGALNESTSILQRMRELSVQATNDTNTASDRQSIQDEMDQLGKSINHIANTTEFNGKHLLDGSMGTKQTSATTGTIVNSSELSIAMSGSSTLASLTDTNGNSLGIAAGDTITASWSVDGKFHTASLTLTSASTATNLFAQIGNDSTVAAPTMTSGAITVDAAKTGTANEINGFNIQVSASDGTIKDKATNALSDFTTGTTAVDAKATDGSATFQIGANTNQTIALSINNMSADSLGVSNLDVSSQGNASTAIKVIDQAISKVSAQRGKLGSYQNRLDHTINNLSTSSQNLTSAQSRITDVDMAKEMMTYTKDNILQQAAQSMLAKANQQPQSVLQLLR